MGTMLARAEPRPLTEPMPMTDSKIVGSSALVVDRTTPLEMETLPIDARLAGKIGLRGEHGGTRADLRHPAVASPPHCRRHGWRRLPPTPPGWWRQPSGRRRSPVRSW